MEYNELVSVIMPVHNGERYLREAIESILNQTHRNYEFLIINDGSTDNSVNIINQYNDARIKVISQENKGAFDSYNTGFRLAKGELILIMDQDDIAEKERIQTQIDYLLKNQLDLVGSYYRIIDKNGKIIGNRLLPTNDNDIKKMIIYKNYILYNPTVCIKRSVFVKNGYFNSNYFPSSDYEFYLRIMDNCKVGNVPDFLYNWRKHSGSIIHQDIQYGMKSSLRISLNHLNSLDFKDDVSYCSFQKGLIYYYNNSLLISFYYFTLAFFQGYHAKNLFRYLIIIIIFGLPLKVIRSNKLVYSKFFSASKKYFDSFFHFEDRY